MRQLYRKTIKILLTITALATLLAPSMASALSAGDVGPWQTTASLPASFNTAGSAEYNGYVYVVSGAGATNHTYYAQLNSDGTLGAWVTSSQTLPGASINRASAVAYNGYLYEIGGFNGSAALTSVYYAAINSDGSIGAWTTSSNSLPAGIESATAQVHDGYVYFFGGNTNGSVNSSAVYYAPLNNDGSVGTWVTSTSPLPLATRRLTSAMFGDYVYVMGGIDSTYTNAVYYAKLNSDGTVGTWTTSTNVLPAALEQLTAVAYNNNVYAIGGDNSGTTVATVYYAPISSDGSVGAWVTATNPLPVTASTSTSIVYNGFIYELGGTSVDLTAVYFARIVDPPVVVPASHTTTKSNAPDTGYGTPNHTNSALIAVVGVSVIVLSLGVVVYKKQLNK